MRMNTVALLRNREIGKPIICLEVMGELTYLLDNEHMYEHPRLFELYQHLLNFVGRSAINEKCLCKCGR